MAGFLYFIPDAVSVTLKDLERLGLGYAFGEQVSSVQVVCDGPGGQQGHIIADDSRVPSQHIGYYSDRQTWLQIPQSNNWVGLLNDSRPTPRDLLRDDAITGHVLTLADGHEWEVPVAREYSPDGYTVCLERQIAIGEDGRPIPGDIVPRDSRLWAIAEKMADHIYSIERSSLEGEDLIELAVEVLARNYRVGLIELVILSTLTDRLYQPILQALVDYPTFTSWASKKNADSDGDNSSDGHQDSRPSTDRPSVT